MLTMEVTRSPSQSVYTTPCFSITARASGASSSQITGSTSSSFSISSSSTGAPASPSTQQAPLQASRLHINFSRSTSKLTTTSPICIISYKKLIADAKITLCSAINKHRLPIYRMSGYKPRSYPRNRSHKNRHFLREHSNMPTH